MPATNATNGFTTLVTTFPQMHGLMRAISGHSATVTSSTGMYFVCIIVCIIVL